MPELPAGMLPDTFEYVIAFTIQHEGDTPFMYNNRPLKNPNLDVTVGVGRSLRNEDEAASEEIRRMFTVKATGDPATADDMRREFRRVAGIDRTAGNLFSAYRDGSLLLMDREAMLESLRGLMLIHWASRGQGSPAFVDPDLEQIPAQAQVALMSYNYGLRLRVAPKMCAAVRHLDFDTAAVESFVPLVDGQKNQAHDRLFRNAATIIKDNLDFSTLPPIKGPFKPPPKV
jgi:hypothetical protein